MKTIAICLVLIVVCAQHNFAQRIPPQLRVVRQTGRYGVSNYRPVVPGLPVGVRGNAVGNAGIKPGSAPVATRPLQGVGAYTFGGAASGRPSFGPSFAYNNAGGVRQQNSPQVAKPQQNQVFRGNAGPQRPLAYTSIYK